MPQEENEGLQNGTTIAMANPQQMLSGYLMFGGAAGPGSDSLESVINLPSGNRLLFVNQDTVVQTPLGKVMINAGSGVLVLQTSDGLAVLNLHDNSRNAVTIDIGGSTIQVPMGRQVVISSNGNARFDDVNPSPIGYREISENNVGSKKVFVSEFSPLSALLYVGQWAKSSDKEKQVIVRRLLKSLAAVQMLGLNRKPFKSSPKS